MLFTWEFLWIRRNICWKIKEQFCSSTFTFDYFDILEQMIGIKSTKPGKGGYILVQLALALMILDKTSHHLFDKAYWLITYILNHPNIIKWDKKLLTFQTSWALLFSVVTCWSFCCVSGSKTMWRGRSWFHRTYGPCHRATMNIVSIR